jgi:hypothetical protein
MCASRWSFTKNQNTHFMFFQKSCCLERNAEKYCRAGHVTDDNMTLLHCILDY